MKRFEEILNGGLHRSRNGVVLGVCKGSAQYFDFSLFWVRAIAVICLIISGFWPITGLYFLAALLMKPEPAIPFQTEEEETFYDSYVYSRRGAAERLRRKYENLERRIRQMEHSVTSKEFEWDRKLNT
jgi:phage shock protein C